MLSVTYLHMMYETWDNHQRKWSSYMFDMLYVSDVNLPVFYAMNYCVM